MRAVEDLGQIGLRQVEFEQAEIAQVGRDQMFEDGLAAAPAEEDLVAYEDIGGAQLASFDRGEEAVGWGEGPHLESHPLELPLQVQNPSRTLAIRVRAKSRDRRSKAGESSSKKLLSSVDTSYCSRKT